jgi:hypothetical protein
LYNPYLINQEYVLTTIKALNSSYLRQIKISIYTVEIKPILARDMQTSLHKPVEPANWLELVAEQVGQLRFGVVPIVVHDSRVVQIERTEKVRLAHPAAGRVDGRQTG